MGCEECRKAIDNNEFIYIKVKEGFVKVSGCEKHIRELQNGKESKETRN